MRITVQDGAAVGQRITRAGLAAELEADLLDLRPVQIQQQPAVGTRAVRDRLGSLLPVVLALDDIDQIALELILVDPIGVALLFLDVDHAEILVLHGRSGRGQEGEQHQQAEQRRYRLFDPFHARFHPLHRFLAEVTQ